MLPLALSNHTCALLSMRLGDMQGRAEQGRAQQGKAKGSWAR